VKKRDHKQVSLNIPTEHLEPASEETGFHLSWMKSWPRLYAIVLGELALLILLFYLFTKSFE